MQKQDQACDSIKSMYSDLASQNRPQWLSERSYASFRATSPSLIRGICAELDKLNSTYRPIGPRHRLFSEAEALKGQVEEQELRTMGVSSDLTLYSCPEYLALTATSESGRQEAF